MRFTLLSADRKNPDALQGLGTYGFIRGEAGFLVGAVRRSERHLEEFGYRHEELVLLCTDLGLGSCWLGGSFTQGSFAARISAKPEEEVPAVAAVGRMDDSERARHSPSRRLIGSERRLPWEILFFRDGFHEPLDRTIAGKYATALEMVRLAPSASNKQPWRVVRSGANWHFYLQRTRGYRKGIVQRMMGVADLQRLDMGIAMCHFARTAGELGLQGEWMIREPTIRRPDDRTEYCITWKG
jgi:nitroreductase